MKHEHPELVSIVALDISDVDSIAHCEQTVAAQTDGIDVLINNAGMNSRSAGVADDERNMSFGALEPEGILQMIRVNSIGPVLVAQRFATLLELGESPRLVNITSWLGSLETKTTGGNYAYCASKAALNMMTRALVRDLGKRGVITLLINPGWVQTDMGGPKAKLTVEESVSGVLAVAGRATMDDAGRFLQWDGTERPW